MRHSLLLAALLLVGCNEQQTVPAQVSASHNQWVFEFSPGMPLQPSSSGDGTELAFEFPDTDGVHYLVAPTSGATHDSLSVTWWLLKGGEPVFQWSTAGNNICKVPAHMSLYFQRRGDDWGGGTKASYRFFSEYIPLTFGGPFTTTVPLTPDKWVNVNGEHDPAGFAAATADLMAVGLTFGGGCFAGHGLWVVGGTARFVMDRFSAR